MANIKANAKSSKKSKIVYTLNKTKREAERLETRIKRREIEGLSIKFLKKICKADFNYLHLQHHNNNFTCNRMNTNNNFSLILIFDIFDKIIKFI